MAKAPSSADAVITVTTVLDGADQVAMGFDDMSDSAREYQHTLADGNKENISFAEGNFVMAESLDEINKKQKRTTEEQRDLIIVTQGMTSALNQMTGGVYKTIGGLEAWGKIGPKTAADWQKNARILEAATGPLEVMLSLYTGWIAIGPLVTSAITAITVAKTGETAAVTANTAAWYANPIFLLAVSIAAVVVGIAVLVDHFNLLTKSVNAAGNAFERLVKFKEDFVEGFGVITEHGLVDALKLEPLKEGLVGV